MGSKKSSAIQALFFKGSYERLVVEAIESHQLSVESPHDLAYLVGALVFRGRRNDAKAFFKKNLLKAELSSQVIAQFFLAVGASRDSDPEEAKKILISNFRKRRELKKDPEALFFVFQGFGFYRNIACRFRKSLAWGERAWACAFSSQFLFGQFLSADLLGHGYVQLGEISRGLEFLDRATNYSRRLGDGGIHSALEISSLVYKVQYGVLTKAEKPLKEALKNLAVEDTYSKSNLLIAYLRWLILCGRLDEARSFEKQVTEHVFRFGHRRQKSDLFLQQAHMEFLQGNFESAKQKLGEAEAVLIPGVDLRHFLDVYELKAQVLGEQPKDLQKLKKLLGRPDRRPKDDTVGTLQDRVLAGESSALLLQTIVQRGYLGLLRHFLKDSQNKLCFLLDLLPKTLVIYFRGNVFVSSVPMTPTAKLLLRTLSKNFLDKGELVERLWGYEYNSLRHDAMLYASIHRLRKTLGPYESYLVVRANRYGFETPSSCKVFEHSLPLAADLLVEPQEMNQKFQNIRQMKVLEYIQKKGALSVSAYSKIFHVSIATAARDLKYLSAQKLLTKLGTKYVNSRTENPVANPG